MLEQYLLETSVVGLKFDKTYPNKKVWIMKKKPSFYAEKELVELLKNNHKAAFNYTYDHYAPGLYGIVCKIVKDESKAKDVMQDAFLKIWKNIGTYDSDKGTLFTWMLNVARNTAIDKLRNDLKFENHIKWDQVSETDLSQASIFNPVLAAIDLRFIVERLLPERKQLIELVYFQGYTHEEASESLNLPLGTVKSRIRTALQDLRNVFSTTSGELQVA